MSTYFKINEEKTILVTKNEKYSEKATTVMGKDTVVFETLDGLISHGGAMACLLAETNTPTVLMTALMDPFIKECAFYHELGHLYYGHPGNTQEYSDQEKMLKEFEADAYMQKCVGKLHSLIALSVLSRSNPRVKNVINLRVTALLLGKWSWKYLI